jgi:tRNA wybutosine-synthesizing protein 1
MDNSLAEDYAKLINLGNPCFIEIKAYMHVGDSLKFYMHENMPSSNDIKKFTAEILKFLPNYEFAAEHYASRVVLLARRDMTSKRFIDFDRLFCKIV